MLWIELDDKFFYISNLSNMFMILSRGSIRGKVNVRNYDIEDQRFAGACARGWC
jgi:hypothetical protein